jgi:hypothetical protein
MTCHMWRRSPILRMGVRAAPAASPRGLRMPDYAAQQAPPNTARSGSNGRACEERLALKNVTCMLLYAARLSMILTQRAPAKTCCPSMRTLRNTQGMGWPSVLPGRLICVCDVPQNLVLRCSPCSRNAQLPTIYAAQASRLLGPLRVLAGSLRCICGAFACVTRSRTGIQIPSQHHRLACEHLLVGHELSFTPSLPGQEMVQCVWRYAAAKCLAKVCLA